MTTDAQTRQSVAFFYGYYWLISVAVAIIAPFIAVYYLELGFSSSRIGVLTAIGPCVAVVTQPLWGVFSDRARFRRTTLQIALVGMVGTAMLFLLNDSFVFIFAVTAFYMACSQATRPLHDAMIIDYVEHTPYRFAPIRLVGTLGFSAMAFSAGRLIGDRISAIFPLHALLVGLTLLVTFGFPKVENDLLGRSRVRIASVLASPFLLFVFGFCFVLYIAFGFQASFLSIHMRQLNLSNTDVGIAMGVAALSEVPVLLVIDRVIRRYGARNVLLFAGFAAAARMLVYSQATALGGIMIAQIGQGVTLIAIYYCAVTIVSQTVPAGLKSTGQALLALVISGLARIVGSIGGGYLGDVVGLSTSFLVAFWIVLVTTTGCSVVFAFGSRHNRPITTTREGI